LAVTAGAVDCFLVEAGAVFFSLVVVVFFAGVFSVAAAAFSGASAVFFSVESYLAAASELSFYAFVLSPSLPLFSALSFFGSTDTLSTAGTSA